MKSPSETAAQVERILLSKADALGDLLIATGLVHATLMRYPESLFFWVVREGNESIAGLLDGAAVFRPNPGAKAEKETARAVGLLKTDDRPWSRVCIIPIAINPYRRQTGDAQTDLVWWGDFLGGLKIDLAVVGSTTRNWLDQLLVLISRARQRVGFAASSGSQELEPVHLKGIDHLPHELRLPDEIPFRSELSERERMEELTRKACRSKVRLAPVIAPTEVDAPEMKPDVIAIAPGVGDPRRRANSAAICSAVSRFLTGHRDLQKACVIIEGPQDRDIGREIAELLAKHGIKTTHLCFKAEELSKLATVLAHVPLLLTHETFYVHLASIIGTPTVALWGLGHWGQFLPDDGRVTVVHTDMACRACGWNCCFDRWMCISDLSSSSITKGLKHQWEQRASPGIHFVQARSAVGHQDVMQALRRSAFTSTRRDAENREQKAWIEELQTDLSRRTEWAETERTLREATEQQVQDATERGDKAFEWANKERALRESMTSNLLETEAQRDAAIKARAEEHQRRASAERFLHETERHRDDALAAVRNEAKLREEAQRLLRETEKIRHNAEAWAEKERGIRVEAQELLQKTEDQRDGLRTWAEEESRKRKELQGLLHETESQRDQNTSWAEEESRQRKELQRLLQETESQRDQNASWAEKERARRRDAQSALSDVETLRNQANAWAEEERRIRIEAQSLLADTEQQRDDATAWAEEERLLRIRSADALAHTETEWEATKATLRKELEANERTARSLKAERQKSQQLDAELNGRQEDLAKTSAKLEETRQYCLDLEERLRQTIEDRDQYQRHLICRLVARLTAGHKKKDTET